MSNIAEVLELYLYDLDVSDDLFRRFVREAIEKDMAQLHGVAIAARLAVVIDGNDRLHSVKV